MTTPDSPSSLQRPIKRLKGFKRVTIPRGQTRLVEIEIDCADLWFWDMDSDRITYDSGRYVFEVGSSSKDIRGTVTATMDGSFTPVLKTVVADCRVSVLKAGETAQTVTTACLSDDSFIELGKARVKYASSNPQVASINADGLLTANASGIATITVSVTYNGRTVSDTYSVKVNPDLSLSSLKLDGKSVLKPGQRQYSALGKRSSNVSAAAKSAKAVTVVEQAPEIPGTAVIKVQDPITGDEERYLVNYGTKGTSDEFKDNSLGSQWNVIRRNDDNLLLSDGMLEITAAAGDINGAADNARNLVLQSANSDWTIETKVETSTVPSLPAQNAGLVAYQDDSHFVKLVYAAPGFRRGQPVSNAPQSGSLQLYAEERGAAKTTVNLNLADAGVNDNTLWLKLEKDGSVYTAFYSVNGKQWINAGQVDIMLKDIQAGMIACEGAANTFMGMFGGPGASAASAAPAAPAQPFKARFDWFRIKNR